MLFLEHIVVVGHEAVGVRTHIVVVLVFDTADGQDRLGQCQVIVGIGIKEAIAVADGGVVILGIGTGTISIGLIGLVHDIVLALRMRQTGRNQSTQTYRLNRPVLQFATEHHVSHLDIVVVVLQLIEYVEAGVEACVVNIGIQTAARIHGEAEGVDVEVALYLTRHHIGGAVQ